MKGGRPLLRNIGHDSGDSVPPPCTKDHSTFRWGRRPTALLLDPAIKPSQMWHQVPCILRQPPRRLQPRRHVRIAGFAQGTSPSWLAPYRYGGRTGVNGRPTLEPRHRGCDAQFSYSAVISTGNPTRCRSKSRHRSWLVRQTLILSAFRLTNRQRSPSPVAISFAACVPDTANNNAPPAARARTASRFQSRNKVISGKSRPCGLTVTAPKALPSWRSACLHQAVWLERNRPPDRVPNVDDAG